jgi:uncharacterized protein (UPF0276 family)
MAYIGVSVGHTSSPAVIEAADFVEIKKITAEEATSVRSVTDKPVYFHLQYSRAGQYLLPTAMSFEHYTRDFIAAGKAALPEQVSLHFGLSAPRISLDTANYMAVALEPPLKRERILNTLEKNLHIIRESFPQSRVLLENIEFIPECLCGGAYRYLQEADFFSQQMLRWRDKGLVDGMVFDIAHALIAAGNHPFYNGLSEKAPGRKTYNDPLETNEEYIEELRQLPSDKLLDFYSSYIDRMPLQLILEIHLSGILRDDNGVYVDAHNEISALELGALRLLLNHASQVRPQDIPVTLEFNRNADRIIPQMVRLREFLSAPQGMGT